jgi:Zn-finger nucleic acid-binding protein
MHCPNDGATLLLSERHGVEIDYCPDCRGVWLDRGELDKIIDRADDDDDEDRYERRDRDRGDHRQSAPPWLGDQRATKKKKRKDWLSDIFELGG